MLRIPSGTGLAIHAPGRARGETGTESYGFEWPMTGYLLDLLAPGPDPYAECAACSWEDRGSREHVQSHGRHVIGHEATGELRSTKQWRNREKKKKKKANYY